MFDINKLAAQMSEQEKIIFLKVLSVLGKVDNDFDDGEKQFIVNVAKMFGISQDKIPSIFEEISKEEVIKEAAMIKNRMVALSLIREACFMANCDGDLSDEEIIFIGKVGGAMGIGFEKIEQISQWVIDYLIWRKQEKIIFN